MNTKLVAATLLSGLSLMGCNTSSNSTTTSSTATPTAVEFVGMAAPSTAAERADAYTTAKAVVTYSDNTTQTVDLSYTQLYGTTDNINGVTAGGLVDVSGFPLLDVSVPAVPTQFVSDAPDGQSLLQIAGADPVALGVSGNPLFMVTHFEYLTADNSGASAYGILPMAMGLSTIDQDATSGALSVVNYQNINMSGVNGLWIPCAGSLSPWNTHLGSEEYEPDARLFETTPTTGPFTPFTTQYYGGAQTARAYQYGAVPEVTVAPTGATSVVKHYSMGRIARELVQVMPDQKTVYMGDDGGYTGLFMFVADVAGDLSAGTLYAGKWTQTSAVDVGTADISWIQLGHATDAQIADLINGTTSGTPIVFSNIFLASSTDPLDVTYTKVRTNNGVEWLKLNPGMEQAAAFLETRRYAAYLGATTEFNKMEGVTINQADKKVYIAISYLQKGMVSGYAATDPADDIQLTEVKSGAVYELSLTGGQSDINAIPATINSQWVATSMTGTVWGTDLTAPDAAGNTAAVDAVANPDNLKFAEKARTLFIGEDSAMHVNNFLWAYNVDTKKLSRIMSIPAGAESTGLQAVENMNGFAYVMSNFQHPGDYIGTMDATLMGQVDPLIRAKWNNKRKAAIGYLSGIPAIQ